MNRPRLLLVGGGHSHLFVLEALRLRASEWRDRMEVAMVSRELQTPYSGMLPGLVAGHYRHNEAHVDLVPLAAAAGVELVQHSIVGLDPDARVAVDASGGQWHFDIASLDIGSTPPLSQVPGAATHALGVKPVDTFLQEWRAFQARAGNAAAGCTTRCCWRKRRSTARIASQATRLSISRKWPAPAMVANSAFGT